jgi:hypothetical protein
MTKWTCILRSMIHWRLINSQRFLVKSLPWVSHRLNHGQLAAGAKLCNELLRILCSVQPQGWQYRLTLDKASFSLSTNHESTWLWEDQALPAREKHMTQARLIIITMVWNPLGFHGVGIIPKAQAFNASDSSEHVLQPFCEFRFESRGRHPVVYAGNAKLHTTRKFQMFYESNCSE